MTNAVKLLLISVLLFGCTCAIRPPIKGYSSETYVDALTEHKFNTAVRLIEMCPEGPYVASGVIVGPDLVYTARHAAECKNGEPILFLGTLEDGREVILQVYKKSDKGDIALLKATRWAEDEVGTDKPVVFDDYAELSYVVPKRGLWVCYVGGGGHPTTKVEKCGKISKNGDVFEVGIQGWPGNSGGPVFDNRGRVMGVLSKMGLTESVVYIVPHSDLPL